MEYRYIPKERVCLFLCKKTDLNEFPPVFMKGEQDLIFATCTPLNTTLNCVNKSVPRARQTISDTHVVEVGQEYVIHSGTVSFPF